jgi:cell division inhibitor SulA
MQFPQASGHMQRSLFERAILVNPPTPVFVDTSEPDWPEPAASFSELVLRGSTGNCLLLLAPILRDLSHQAGTRWLTLVDAPAPLNQAWLRQNGINRQQILMLQSQGAQNAVKLASEALRLGRSHTVISWITPLDRQTRKHLIDTAIEGHSQSLNIIWG